MELLTPCPVPPTPLGWQPRPHKHRHVPTLSVPPSPASHSINTSADHGSHPAPPGPALQPLAPSDKREMTSGCFSLHCSGQKAMAPHWKLLQASASCRSAPDSPRVASARRAGERAGACRGVQGRAEAACSSLHSPAPRLPLPCTAGAATNLRCSRRSRWSRSLRGCWSCRHRAPSPRAPRP